MNIQLPEIVAIGIYNSSLAVKNRSMTATRKTTMFEIEIPIEEGGVSFINEEKAPISRGMLICAKPGQSRHTRLPYKCHYIHMMVQKGELYDLLMSVPNYVNLSDDKKYYEIFEKMCKYFDTALETDELILQSLILQLVFMIDRQTRKLLATSKSKSSNFETIERVIKYIKSNLTSDLSLEKVSAFAGFSPIHFHNCFKSATGLTLREFIEDQRIKRAVNLLISTDKSLTDIAYECGFSSQSYFSFAFKRRMKATPREYAKQIFERYEAE